MTTPPQHPSLHARSPSLPSRIGKTIGDSGSTGIESLAVRAGLAMIAGALAFDAFAFFIDVLAGLRIVDGVPSAEVGYEYGSTLSRVSNLLLPAAVAIGGVTFLWWFHSTYNRRSADHPMRFDSRWAVLGWFVPGLNLVRPPQIMSELTGRSSLVGPWWGLWAFGALIQVALRFITPEIQEGWVIWQTTAFVADLALLASVLIAFGLVDEAEDLDHVTHRPGLGGWPTAAKNSPAPSYRQPSNERISHSWP